ncbi:L-lactate dehydrogenase, partial [Geobacillus stearothermophilus]|nr:L-lactate dehydrogenase [Geobacillus stearothermophilus]
SMSIYIDGQYNEQNVYIGVPAIINRNGIREVMELKLNETEQQQFHHSVTVLKDILSRYFDLE